MTRRKVNNNELLTRKIGLRVSDPFYKKMEGWLEKSNCQTVAELARIILYKEEIIWYQKDASFEATATELAGIRNELKAIGININQATKYFNSKAVPADKIYQTLKILDEYKKINAKVELVLSMMSELSNMVNKKWSPK